METDGIAGKRAVIILLYFLLSFPMGYYAYKFSSPDISGQKDFYSYYPLYKDFNVASVESPFNIRLASPFLVYLLNKTDLFYDVKIVYQKPAIEQKIYFNAVLVNYLSAVFTCFIIFLTVSKFLKNTFLAFASGVLYLFQYGTLYWGLTGLVDGFSVMLFALIFYFYMSRSYWIILFLAIAVFQRELIFLTAGLIAFVELFFSKQKKYLFAVLFFSVMFFLTYFILRKTIFYTPLWSSHLSPDSYLDLFSRPTVSLISYLRQSVFTQNILLIYFLIIFYKLYRKMEFNKMYLLILVLNFAEMNVVSLSLLPVDAGRYFYIGSAALLFFLAYELKFLFIKSADSSTTVIPEILAQKNV